MPLYSTVCPLPINRKMFRHRGTASPIPQSGLSLWLKADAGISKFSYNYVSRIVLAGGSNGNGTYNASGDPGWNFGYNLPNSYNIGSIGYSNVDNNYTLNLDDGSIISSYDGINWNVDRAVYTGGPTLSGITGDYSGANGFYDQINDPWDYQFLRQDGNWNFYIQGSPSSFAFSAYNTDTSELFENLAVFSSGSWVSNSTETASISGGTTGVTSNPTAVPTGTITNTTAQSNYITSWADQSGNGNNASILNPGEEPTFVSSFLNGKPAIEFNGQGQVMQIADSNSLDFSNMSVFIVLKYLGQGTGNNIVYIKNADSGSQTDQAMYGLVATNGGFVSFSQNIEGWSDYQTQIDITDSVSKILSMTYNGSDQLVYSNGSISDTFSIGGNIATSTGLLQIGGYNQSFDAAEYFYGQIAEIIMYNRAVTETERQQVESYLNTKYAIY